MDCCFQVVHRPHSSYISFFLPYSSRRNSISCTLLLLRDLDLARLDVVRDVLGAAAVDLAAGGESSTEDFLDGTLKVLGHRLEAHGAGDVDDLVEGNALGVLDVLLLLPVTRGLLKGLDDERRGRRNNRDSSLTVLDGQLDRDTETLPVASGLGDIFTDLYSKSALFLSTSFFCREKRTLGRKTKGTDLGSERRRGTDFTTSGSQVDDLNLGGIEFGSCACLAGL